MTTSTGAKFEISAEDAPRILEALELPPEATIDDVIAKIEEMMGGGEEEGDEEGEMPPEAPADGMMEAPAFKALQEEVSKLKAANDALEHNNRISKYAAMVRQEFPSIPGKPEEIAERLASLERDGQKAVVEMSISQYRAMEEASKQLGVTQALGTLIGGNDSEIKDPYEDKVENYMSEHGVERPKAIAHFATNDPKGFGEYRRRINARRS